jgi:hypothetical protein
MTLEFEKIGPELETMGPRVARRRREEADYLQRARNRLVALGDAWNLIEATLAETAEQAPRTRLARPLADAEPLAAVYDLPPCPSKATIIGVDGSQIVPDRHAPFLYYLLNVGSIIYRHGSGDSPLETIRPALHYEDHDVFVGEGLLVDGAIVGARRDLAEITLLAELVESRREERPLAMLDQRLLYWPTARPGWERERNEIVRGWQRAMVRVREADGLLCGIIDRSRKNAVLALLQRMDRHSGPELPAAFWPRLTDADLIAPLLGPGQRSCVFLERSEDNRKYAAADPAIEVCFFYLNAAADGSQVVRVDLPRWVAADGDQVARVHALLYDQCQILGGYPYVLTRADELAVVGRRDQAELDNWIAMHLEAHGHHGDPTAKQQSKEWARAGKKRFEVGS